MRLTACGCRADHYQRGARAWWMKIVWTRRLYYCYCCDARLLLPPQQVKRKRERARAPAGPVAFRRS